MKNAWHLVGFEVLPESGQSITGVTGLCPRFVEVHKGTDCATKLVFKIIAGIWMVWNAIAISEREQRQWAHWCESFRIKCHSEQCKTNVPRNNRNKSWNVFNFAATINSNSLSPRECLMNYSENSIDFLQQNERFGELFDLQTDL